MKLSTRKQLLEEAEKVLRRLKEIETRTINHSDYPGKVKIKIFSNIEFKKLQKQMSDFYDMSEKAKSEIDAMVAALGKLEEGIELNKMDDPLYTNRNGVEYEDEREYVTSPQIKSFIESFIKKNNSLKKIETIVMEMTKLLGSL
jgi:hypothetical protein